MLNFYIREILQSDLQSANDLIDRNYMYNGVADTFHSHAPGIKTTVMCATLQRGPRPQLRDAHKQL